MNRLPFPFSMLQPHGIELRIYLGEPSNSYFDAPNLVHQQIYKKSQMESAITAFLQGAETMDAVTITDG